MSDGETLVVGVLADTHVPDRAAEIPQGLKDIFAYAGVAHILHAGDVCARRVLDELEEIAPVSAVRGNRDFLITPALPMSLELELGGVQIGLLHGHGGPRQYWLDKLGYIVAGYRVERYIQVARQACPDAQAWVFGHSHRAENRRVDGRLVFNPGAAIGYRFGPVEYVPSCGLLRIYPGGNITGEIIRLNGAGSGSEQDKTVAPVG
jgi:hypothetical protein